MIKSISLKEVNRFLLFAVLIVLILYFAQKVLIPVVFFIFFAMLFTPLSNRLERHGWKRWVTSLVSVLIIVILTAGIGVLVYMQSAKMAEKFPQIEQKSKQFMTRAQDYVSEKLNVPKKKQDEMVNKQMKSGGDKIGAFIKKGLAGIAGFLASAAMVLIFTFLFLLQRDKYESFFVQMCTETPPDEAKQLIQRISKVAQSYLTGRVLSILIFTALFTTGFLIVGLENAFLLAFVAALLTIIPYIGSIVGGLFPVAVALVTGDSSSAAVGTLAVVVAVNAIDNYFIEPYVIGGEVNVNAFFTILILLIGGMIWGIAGMVLFLPMLGIAKIVFDEVPALKPYGFLVGDQEGEKQSDRLVKKLRGLFKKSENPAGQQR